METVTTKNVIYGGKFLTFTLGQEVFGIEVIKFKEIISLMDITKVPQTPEYMKGIVNLRGKVIPVIDLRLKLSMPEEKHTEETCVIVVEVGAYRNLPDPSELPSRAGCVVQAGTSQQIGIIVDKVSEVLIIKSEEIEEAPHFEQEIDTTFIMGLGKTKGKIIILLDIENVLSTEELEKIEKAMT